MPSASKLLVCNEKSIYGTCGRNELALAFLFLPFQFLLVVTSDAKKQDQDTSLAAANKVGTVRLLKECMLELGQIRLRTENSAESNAERDICACPAS